MLKSERRDGSKKRVLEQGKVIKNGMASSTIGLHNRIAISNQLPDTEGVVLFNELIFYKYSKRRQ